VSSDWTRRYLAYSDVLTTFYANIFRRQLCPDGEPLVLSPFVEAAGPQAQQIYAELTRPQRISDVMQTVVLREARRLAVVGANRHESVGPLKNDDLAIMRLLVPHIRRAVKIVDILDVRKIEAQTLSATLDYFTAGVIVVGDRGRILHANEAARRMLSAREPIAAVNGVLSVHDAKADQFKCWKDFSGKPVFYAPAGAQNWLNWQRIFKTLGYDFKHVQIDLKSNADALQAGTIVGSATYTTAGKSLPSYWKETEIRMDIKVVNPCPDEIEKLRAAGLAVVDVDPRGAFSKDVGPRRSRACRSCSARIVESWLKRRAVRGHRTA
jgi:PAS domain-containing protein